MSINNWLSFHSFEGKTLFKLRSLRFSFIPKPGSLFSFIFPLTGRISFSNRLPNTEGKLKQSGLVFKYSQNGQ